MICILLAGGPDLEEEELECVSLQVPGEEEVGRRSVQGKKRMGQALPSRLYLFLCMFPYVSF